MTHTPLTRRSALSLLGLVGVSALAACSSNDPLADSAPAGNESAGGNTSALVIGSQAYYSNEIIAELFAQALENAGITVERQYQIGQREVYMAELEAGKVDVLPEYTGNLLQYYNKDATAASPQEVFDALTGALPQGLTALPFAEATDQDSYTVTNAYATEHGLASLEDLAKIDGPLTIAANSELETRPFGPAGLKDKYGVDATVIPVEDSGGPLTVKALTDGTAQLANIYTSSPLIESENLVVLEDPKSLFLPQNITPIVSDRVNDTARSAIEAVTSRLSPTELIALNAKSVNDQAKSAAIAKAWLAEKGIV